MSTRCALRLLSAAVIAASSRQPSLWKQLSGPFAMLHTGQGNNFQPQLPCHPCASTPTPTHPPCLSTSFKTAHASWRETTPCHITTSRYRGARITPCTNMLLLKCCKHTQTPQHPNTAPRSNAGCWQHPVAQLQKQGSCCVRVSTHGTKPSPRGQLFMAHAAERPRCKVSAQGELTRPCQDGR